MAGVRTATNARATVLFSLSLILGYGNPVLAATELPPRVIEVESVPESPIIEVRDANQFLHFGFIVRNHSGLTLRISEIQLSVYDGNESLVMMKSLNTDAFAPSIAVIGKQMMAPGGELDVFNPFFEFDSNVPLHELRYSFCLLREEDNQERERNLHRLPDDCDFRQQVTISPRTYDDKTSLILPLEGRIFVWEGHDFYAHHLRVPLGSAEVQKLGISANSNDFASDFIYVDAEGRAFHDDARNLQNWYGYGKPVYAPGAGTVLASADDIPNNWFENAQATAIGHPHLPVGKDPKDIGNFVLIDHGNGEYSLLVHMEPGSVKVHPGERVKQGGRFHFSSSALFVDERPGGIQGMGIASLLPSFPPSLWSKVNSCGKGSGEFG